MAEVFKTTLPAQTAGGATSTTLIAALSNVEGTNNYLTRVELIPPPGFTTVTGVATNNATFTLRLVRAGVVAIADVASVTLASGTNLVAETILPLTIDATAAQRSSLQQGDVFDCAMTQNGTGLAVGIGVVVEVEVS